LFLPKSKEPGGGFLICLRKILPKRKYPLNSYLFVIGSEGPAWGGGEGLPEAFVPGSELSLATESRSHPLMKRGDDL